MKIILSGYYGHGNTGDEAVLLSIANELAVHDITVISLNPEYTGKVQRLNSVNFFDIAAVEDVVRHSDMVIMGGGGIFQEFPGMEYYGARMSEFLMNPYGKPKGRLTAYAIVPLMAAAYRKPLVFLGHGVGPFHSDEAQAFYGFIFSISSLITVRDRYSAGWVEKLCKGREVHLSADPSFLLDIKEDETISEFLRQNNLEEDRFITVSLRDFFRNANAEKTVRETALALRSFLSENELKVLFVPFQNIPMSDYPTQDIRLALQLRDWLDPDLRKRMVIADTCIHPEKTPLLMRKALFGVGMRYHFLIFSIMNGTPVISLSYDEKCHSLMEEIGLKDLSIRISEINARTLAEHLREVSRNPEKYRAIITKALPEMRERADFSFTLLESIVSAGVPITDTQRKADAAVHEMKGILASKDVLIEELTEKLNAQLAENKRSIIDLKSRLSDAQWTLAKLNSEASEREKSLQALAEEVAMQDLSIQEKDRTINEIEKKLHGILTSRTWRLSQMYGRYLSQTRINSILEGVTDRIIGKTNRSAASGDGLEREQNLKRLSGVIHQLNLRKKRFLFVIVSSVEFDDVYNQRAINLSKYLAHKDYNVLYVAWRWSKNQAVRHLYEEVHRNIFQIPVDDFVDSYQMMANLLNDKRYIILEFPHPHFLVPMLFLKESGFANLYDIIDDWEEFNAEKQAPWFQKEYEDAMITNADIVTAVSPPLVRKFSRIRQDISLIPNGFSGSFLGGKAGISRYRGNQGSLIDIGYFGHLTDSWFDWNLIFEAAGKNNDFVFHIIGYGESEKIRFEMSKYKNIICHGKIHPSKLHQYAGNWDVAMLPFKKSKLSSSVDPIKIYEYLYFGLPTVVQGIDHLESMPYVGSCTDCREFEETVRSFTKMKREGLVDYEEMQCYLKECVWERRFDSMLSLFNHNGS